MIFTTQIFLFLFMPICLLMYTAIAILEQKKIGAWLAKCRAKDIILIIFSFGFYMWACFDDLFRFIGYIVIVYLLARWIEKIKRKNLFISIEKEEAEGNSVLHKKVYISVFAFVISIALVLFFLIYYKYAGILNEMWNTIFATDSLSKSLMAPIGLSFITFSAISYLADIYRGKATGGSFIDCALYLSFFPKVVSGPIVLWQDFQKQITTRKTSLQTSVDGLNRIMIGFAKKVILADSFGACVAQMGTYGIDQITAIGSLILYMLQIYYDFSAYSDIAIGLSKLFGFEFKENFNFPYRSKSISEFWRRWHISLGTWFREYVYFPLGGSRCEKYKTLRNLGIVFALTGIWHGAGWNYIIWGFINGFLVILERIIANKKIYTKLPNFIKYIGTMFVVMLFWQLFRFPNIEEVINWFEIIMGTVTFDTYFYTWQYYFDMQIITFTIIGIIGATLLGNDKIIKQYKVFSSTKIGYLIQEIIIIALFVLSILFMINSTYSPFIYFQY